MPDLSEPPSHSAAWWSHPSFTDAAAHREPGRFLRAYRHRHQPRLTQETIGRWLIVGQSHVSELERGLWTPPPDTIERWFVTLGVPRQLWWFLEDPQAIDPTLTYDTNLQATLDAVLDLGRVGVDRRSFMLQAAGFSTAAATAASRDWLLATFDNGLLSPTTTLSTAQVDAVRRTGQLFMDLDTANGGGHARDRLTRYVIDNVTPLLHTNTPDTPQGRALHEVAAEQLHLLGMMNLDDGRSGIAQGWFTQALRLTQEVANPDLGAWCIAGLSLCALTTGDYREARQLAAAGRHGATNGHSRAVVAELHAYQARAEAGLGHTAATARHVLATHQTLDQVRPDTEPAWGLLLDDGYLASECALALAQVHDRRAVTEHAQRSLLESKRRGWLRPLVYSHTALAHAALDQPHIDLDIAVAEATAAVQVAAHLQSSISRNHVNVLRTRLAPHTATPAVQEFFELTDLLLAG